MVAQSPPYAEQNAQHSAQLFRLATFSPWRDVSGIVGPADLAVSAQSTPNMSVVVGAGRAWIKGTQLASVSGGTWSTQGAYYCYNDAPVSLTVAAADPTNPRIDAVVAYVLDSFYSGASNLFVLGIVTGTPANSPTVPAIPSNGLLLGTLAVAANATSISSGNISATGGLLLTTRGGVQPVLSTDSTAGTYDGQYRDHPTKGLQRWNAAAGAWRSIFWQAPVRYSDTGVGGANGAPGPYTMHPSRTIDPSAIFGPGFGALVLIDARTLGDCPSGTWDLQIVSPALSSGVLTRDSRAFAGRNTLVASHQVIIPAGTTQSFSTAIANGSGTLTTYGDGTNNRCAYVVIPIPPA